MYIIHCNKEISNLENVCTYWLIDNVYIIQPIGNVHDENGEFVNYIMHMSLNSPCYVYSFMANSLLNSSSR